jgi:hypothetical protein
MPDVDLTYFIERHHDCWWNRDYYRDSVCFLFCEVITTLQQDRNIKKPNGRRWLWTEIRVDSMIDERYKRSWFWVGQYGSWEICDFLIEFNPLRFFILSRRREVVKFSFQSSGRLWRLSSTIHHRLIDSVYVKKALFAGFIGNDHAVIPAQSDGRITRPTNTRDCWIVLSRW